VQYIKPRAEKLKIGAGSNADVEMGPLVTEAHLQKVKSYIDLGVNEGAELVVDGRKHKSKQGFYLGASLFDNVKPTMRIYKEEIFGPVLSIVRVPNFEAALKLVNEHEYGNGTAIFTDNPNIAREFSARVQAGMVGINIPIPVPAAQHSFGGWKRSLFGDIHMYGAEGVQFYTHLKTVMQRWPGKFKEKSEFNIPTTK